MPALIRAIIVSEDKRFLEHDGVDWQAAGKAAWSKFWNSKTRDASTLSMQLAGLLDADSQRHGRGSILVVQMAMFISLGVEVVSTRSPRRAIRRLPPSSSRAHTAPMKPLAIRLSAIKHALSRWLYRTVQTYLATWPALQDDGTRATAPAVIEREFRRYLDYSVLAHGFTRARYTECGHDFLVAYSCKCRGVYPSCTTRRMAETAAHLADHVISRLPVRQWVFSVPKRLHYRLECDLAVLSATLHIFSSSHGNAA